MTMKRPHMRSVPAARRWSSARGFTLIEMMITLIVLAVVVLALTTVMMTASHSKQSSVNLAESTQAARVASDMIARDLRSAGYRADLDYTPRPQTPLAYVDSLQVLINENLSPFPDTSSFIRGFPQAYNPASTGKPFPLVGTAWTPPIRYRTGAEIVRWTLDANNDGALNASDLTDPNAADAQRTRNPNDWELLRQVYGDSSGASAGTNGPTTERVALISKPGGSVAPLFTVYMKNATQPWDWSMGPVPVDSLDHVARVLVRVTAPSPKPDNRGNYASTVYSNEVHSLRNVPELGQPEYGVDGYVFNDLNKNGVQDAGEPGISGARVNLGFYSMTTGNNGYFLLPAPAGTYTLRHTPPANYGVFTSPDSFVVTVPPAVNRSFADTARVGGWVTCHAFNDLNANGVQDAGEPDMSGVKFTMDFMNQVGYTNTSGIVSQFAGVGFYTESCVAPDSFFCLTANPVTGSMTAGGSVTYQFALAKLPFGTIQGQVYRDNNRNGVLDAGEAGIANVWVGVSKDGGLNFLAFTYTDAGGNFSVEAPQNDPPHTVPYDLMVIPPTGFFPTSTMDIGNLWVQGNQTYTGKNFGMSSFQVISLNASRVLSLVSGDVVEKDYIGAISGAHKDADILLGADAAGTDQISAWFNQWNNSPLFNATPSYSRSAPQAVLSMALDTLDSVAPSWQPDLITGTKGVVAGNFFVWFTQNTSGNEGYIPTVASQSYKTTDGGDVQAVLTYDCAGGLGTDQPDIIVGTKSPTANQGSVEVWKSSNAATPTFTREDIYPPSGVLAGGGMGEVTCMALADMDGDGKKDLIVGTRTGNYSGQVMFFKFVSKNTAPHFLYMSEVDFDDNAVTCLGAVDVNHNGIPDVVVGTQTSTSAGNLIYLRNDTPSTFGFSVRRTVTAPGIVTTMGIGDFGGISAQDLVVGFRQSTAGYAGGVRIYFLDSNSIPFSGTDPSNGALINWVPAVTVNNFNFGANPAAVPPFLTDFAVGVKSGVSTGALVVFIR
jgi:prepilin-type N-terminal cleavage/methylation domain-containing protein